MRDKHDLELRSWMDGDWQRFTGSSLVQQPAEVVTLQMQTALDANRVLF